MVYYIFPSILYMVLRTEHYFTIENISAVLLTTEWDMVRKLFRTLSKLLMYLRRISTSLTDQYPKHADNCSENT